MNRLLLLLASVALVGAAPAPRDWRTNVVESPAGWTFGKPGAPLLVEYGSLGCPHCAHFAAETGSQIDGLVKAGKLRFGFRPFLIFPHDRAGFVLARCVPSSRRLGFIEAIYAGQADTRARLAAADGDDALRGRLYNAELAGPVEYAKVAADIGNLTTIAASHGLTAAAVDRCLADTAAHQWVTNADLTSRASGVRGTPTYFWKGVKLEETLTPEGLLAKLPR
ncbi:thioredoxin domain-containing protein [Sphingomonas astaxanthinifaciens]|uniref:Thioredoxin-like fold domain-containing protein n=1 Tax=Sphingomonas astaxanthinifaciens DSM 22298 TaxID=1123267 RepID=A0ABQ5Z326_9SPHN|nr:thioredoxin domain-containing protein [Sphingomonas astaxanthinifaciens]GLR47185.1 hypothetical protein GCM10007925_08960 [Sphingomonas astaxanthinifaciens DSM 22298]